MAERPPAREIERTQPGPAPGPFSDPGEGLRAHLATSPRRTPLPHQIAPGVPPVHPEGARYLFHVYNAIGGFVRTYLPDQTEAAEARAVQLGGFVTVTQVVRDYREVGVGQ